MSAPRTIIDLRARLDEAIGKARAEAEESRSSAPNSYGAGYDDGFLEALNRVLRTINGREDGTL